MKNTFIFIFCLCWIVQVEAQVSVYECGIYPTITQTQIENAGYEFNLPCVVLDQTFDFNGSSSKSITSPTSVHVKPGFHAGNYDSKGGMHIGITPKAEFDVAVMNYGSLEYILRYEKFELGIGLPTTVLGKIKNFILDENVPANEIINPFLEWKIRVTATFLHSETGTTQMVDGFYTRELERDFVGNTWIDEGTDHPFRVRFAPPLNGEWKCKVNISLEGVPTYESSEFPIQVIESGNPGFTKVHPNKKNLMRGDEIIFPVGTNLPFDGGDGSVNMQWTFNQHHVEDYPMSFWKRYIDSVDSYGKKGGEFIRIINHPASGEIEFEKLGNYYNRLKFATEMDNLIEVCRTNGTMIDFSLMYHIPFQISGENGQIAWDYTNYWPSTNTGTDPMPAYCYASAFNSSQPRDMITNDEAFKYIKQRYRYYISRYGYSTNIYLFEMVNEPWHLDQHCAIEYEPYRDDAGTHGDLTRAAVTKFNSGLAEYIKNHLGHKQHLLGCTGYLRDDYPSGHVVPKQVNDLSWYSPNIDIICINEYSSRPDKLIISKDNDASGDDNNGFYDGEESYAFTFHKLFERYHKPVVMTEMGGAIDFDGCSDYLHNIVDVMRFGFTGLAGFNQWVGWDFSDGKDQSNLWTAVIRSQYHMNGDDVINTLSNENGGWLQGREVEDKDQLREHQYYVSNNKESCVGYVYNRTYNVRTNGCPDYNPDGFKEKFAEKTLGLNNEKTMHIQGLKKNTDYEIDWYSFRDGNYMFSECFNTNSQGRTPLRHPTLTTEYPTYPFPQSPLVWYVVKQHNCQGAKSLEQTTSENTENNKMLDKGYVNVSPNPFNATIQIEADEPIGLVLITDAQGKIVKQERFFTNLANLSTVELTQGVYFLWSEKESKSIKIIKL